MKTYSKFTNYELNETLIFLERVKISLYVDFCHIENKVSKKFKDSINFQIDQINKELDKRGY